MQSPAWQPVIASVPVLEDCWRRHSDRFLAHYEGLPDETWFPAMEGDRPVAFRPTVARFASDEAAYRLVVNQGRHRLRWLLQRGAGEVVLSLSHDSFPTAVDHGLVTRLLNHGDWILVGFDVGPIYYRPSAAR